MLILHLCRCVAVHSSSTLSDLRDLVSQGIHKSDAIVLLATKGVLARPWCLIELLEATRKKLPILVVEIAGRGFDRTEAQNFVTELEAEMAEPSLNLLRKHIGPDLAELKGACLEMLDSQEELLVLDPHAGDSQLVAMMKDVVEMLAQRTGRTIKWERGLGQRSKGPQRSQLSIEKRICRGGSAKDRNASLKLEASGLMNSALGNSARKSEFSLTERLRKVASMDPVANKASAVFVCCSRSDALTHARVLRSELAVRLDRACAVGGGASTAEWIPQSEAVIVVLTKALVTDPGALFEIWTALSLGVPIITVAIAGAYDFARAEAKLANLPLAVQRVDEKRTSKTLYRPDKSESSRTTRTINSRSLSISGYIQACTSDKSPHSGRDSPRSRRDTWQRDNTTAEKLKGLLPNNADVASVGKTIHER